WIGLIITAQAFQEVPGKHAPAVAIGLIPCLAGWALLLVESALRAAGTTLFVAQGKFGSDLSIYGLISLNQGFILSSMALAAMLVHIIDRRFIPAAGWAFAMAGMSALGIIHAYKLNADGIHSVLGFQTPEGTFGLAAPEFAISYAAMGVVLLLADRLLLPSTSVSSTAISADSSGLPVSDSPSPAVPQ
ncbi:MAG TPA: hypothetical protein VK970_19395, partial [Candidatus Methylacidiphilales bacterium]|nr:hypothetical protein [Candidatus Methylacidiphilales bacterium]